MCGITGALALNHKAITTTYAKPMTDILAHRGPDDAGYLFFHTGCQHERNVAFELHLTDDKFRHISELLPSIDSRAGLLGRKKEERPARLLFGGTGGI